MINGAVRRMSPALRAGLQVSQAIYRFPSCAKITLRGIAAVFLSITAALANGEVVPLQGCSSNVDCHEIRGVITEKDLGAVRAIAEQAISERSMIASDKSGLLKKRGITERTVAFRLSSKGGDVGAAIQIGLHLRRLSAMAIVNDECLSACVFVLAGATQRGVPPHAAIGIHRPYSLRTDIRDFDAIQQEHTRLAATVRKYFEETNLPITLYDAMMRVPPESIRVLTRQELTDFGLNQTDPVQRELFDSRGARKYGLTKLEYLRRKGEVSTVCARWLDGRAGSFIAGNTDEYFKCEERLMQRPQ